MDNQTISELERRIAKLEREALRFRKGQVTATAPLEAKIGASDESQVANTVSGTNMAENDSVAALSNATDLLLLGKIVDEPTGVSLTTTTEWNEQQYITDQGTVAGANNQMGYSVAITSDGSRAVLGAPLVDVLAQTNEGVAFVFKRTGTSWALEQAVTFSFTDGANYQLGAGVAINDAGDTVVVGAGSAAESRVFTRSGTLWSQQADLGKRGTRAAMSENGDTLALGSTFLNEVTVHTRTAGTWSLQTTISSVDSDSVALSADGNTLAIGDVSGNSGKGQVKVYTRASTTWSLEATLTDSTGASADEFGASVALSDNGNTLVVGAPSDDISSSSNQGSAVIYTRVSTTWTQAHRLTYSGGATDDAFGTSVSINGAGDRIVVGQQNDDIGLNADRGSVVIYDYSGSVWDETTTLSAALGTAGDNLGASVAISDDGNYIAAGAPFDDVSTYSDHGSASIFALTTVSAAGVTVGDGTVTEAKLANNAVTSAKILDGTIVNADINASAAIAYGKLALTTSIVNGDISNSAAIAYSKLALSGSIVDADVNASAAIAYSKLALTGSIVNADVATGAAIALSKLATDPLARANHTGTQTASTVSDFDTQVRTSRLDQMAAPTASVSLNSQKITSLLDPTSAQDAATKTYVDTAAAAGVTFGTPGAIQPDDTASAGVASTAARSDHRHSIAAASAGTITGSNAEGTSTSFARADHNHALDTGVVTSTNILDGTILNADINASAAIALTKLASETTINDIAFGIQSVSTSASSAGTQTVDISWGNSAPTVVLVAPAAQVNYGAQSSTYTTSGGNGRFTIRIRHLDNTSQTTSVDVAWLAFR